MGFPILVRRHLYIESGPWCWPRSGTQHGVTRPEWVDPMMTISWWPSVGVIRAIFLRTDTWQFKQLISCHNEKHWYFSRKARWIENLHNRSRYVVWSAKMRGNENWLGELFSIIIIMKAHFTFLTSTFTVLRQKAIYMDSVPCRFISRWPSKDGGLLTTPASGADMVLNHRQASVTSPGRADFMLLDAFTVHLHSRSVLQRDFQWRLKKKHGGNSHRSREPIITQKPLDAVYLPIYTYIYISQSQSRQHQPSLKIGNVSYTHGMMTSSNGNIFRVTGLLWREAVTGEFPSQRPVTLSLICAWINCWVNNREPSDLKRHRAHYDVIWMQSPRV